jgi:hypothetical protein
MAHLIKYIFPLILLLDFNFVSKHEGMFQIVDRFLNASGGLDKWQKVNTLTLEHYFEDGRGFKKYDIVYRDEPLNYYSDLEGTVYLANEYAIYNKDEKSGEWSNMTVLSGNMGLPIEFHRSTLFWALEFAKNNNLSEKYSLSDKNFGKEFNVLEMLYRPNASERFRKGYNYYILFSKKTGLIERQLLYKNGKQKEFTDYYDYTEVDGYVIPLKQAHGFSKQTREGFNNTLSEYDSLKKERDSTYVLKASKIPVGATIRHNQKVQFNQPIDESVFEMN